ncbi:MAG: hypothetical protein L0I76_08935 [Pseudonocardia sp.]|nr:hypothetical protein [Pseudonocardia sp.]
MTEVCFCGRYGPLTDRTPILDDDGPSLQCPTCGHVDRLTVFPEPVRLRLWTEAKERELWDLRESA